MFCKHNWVKDHEFTDKSAAEKCYEMGMTRIKNAHPEMFESRHLVVYVCLKCGKIQEFQLKSY